MSGATRWHADVPTASASRYLQQLSKHWSHRFATDFTAEAATIALPGGVGLAMAAEAERLRLTLDVPADADAARMQQVVAVHIDRFAHREAPLTYDWRADVAAR